jgi:probable rRNA maturation factor
MSIQFIFTETSIALSERKRLKLFIEGLLKREKKSLVSLFFIFCKDEYLLNINKQFLQHDDYTDIITFNLSDNINTIEGEIYISIDRIKENATLNRVSQKEELHRVMFHGVLHLCGYKDKTPKDKKKMTTAENKCLELYFS